MGGVGSGASRAWSFSIKAVLGSLRVRVEGRRALILGAIIYSIATIIAWSLPNG